VQLRKPRKVLTILTVSYSPSDACVPNICNIFKAVTSFEPFLVAACVALFPGYISFWGRNDSLCFEYLEVFELP
jgi:hypothetical protein